MYRFRLPSLSRPSIYHEVLYGSLLYALIVHNVFTRQCIILSIANPSLTFINKKCAQYDQPNVRHMETLILTED